MTRGLRGIAMGMALVCAAAVAPPAQAATTTTVKKAPSTTARKSTPTTQAAKAQQLARLRDQLAHVSKEEAALLDQLDDVLVKRKELDARLAQLDRELGIVSGAAAEAEAGLEAAASEVVRAQTKLAVAQSGLAEARRDLKEKAVQAYIRQPNVVALDALLKVRTYRQMSAGHTFLSKVVADQASVVERFEAFRREAIALQSEVEVNRDAARAQRDVAVTQRDAVARARDAQARARAEVAAQQAKQESIVAEARRRKAEFQAQIKALQRESDSIGSLLRGVQKGQVFTGSGKGTFGLPVVGARLSSNFGYRTHPIYGDKRLHNGLDFAAPTGTPILAAADGTVVTAGARGGYGNTVVIDHGKALATLYAHQSSVAVAPGTRVKKGQVVGRVGSTGASTGPHLHFEVRVNGNPVDPLPYL